MVFYLVLVFNMARLGSYYGLCPLIDSKSLLGISGDREKGVVLITLGKNIASKYKLSDQKQICSWRTKEKFSSAVVYDKKLCKYLAVFNHSHIKLWEGEEENLDKLKKYKFNKQIYSIFSGNGNTYIVFQNGSIYLLEDALEERKTLSPEQIILESEQIENILSRKLNEQLYVGLITKSSEKSSFYWTKIGSDKWSFSAIKLERDDFILRGCVLHTEENIALFLTVWSDGRIFSYQLENPSKSTMPGQLFAVTDYISTNSNVCMLSLDENYMAIYGANCNEEGAIIIIYNTQFKVTQSKQPFKLFTNDAKLWSYENNLLLPVGQHMAVIPFYLETEQLAALVGSHKIVQNIADADVTIVQEFEVASWDNKHNFKDAQIPEVLSDKIKDLLKQGLPESIIVGQLLPDILKKPDIELLSLCITYFVDIPEKYLAQILKYLIVTNSKYFNNEKQHASKLFPSNLQPAGRTELIDQIFCKTFNEVLLLPHLRSEFAVTDVLSLINYISFLLSEDGHELPSMNLIKSEARLIDWSCILIDSSFQKLLLGKDESVKNVLIQFGRLIEEHLTAYEDLRSVSSLLSHFKRGKLLGRNTNVTNLKYSIEQISLY